jgi:hypothetical protein
VAISSDERTPYANTIYHIADLQSHGRDQITASNKLVPTKAQLALENIYYISGIEMQQTVCRGLLQEHWKARKRTTVHRVSFVLNK